ncbi:hypothetical protein N9W84_00865 [bacterium]|nr:hypothetical protein [bacterium]
MEKKFLEELLDIMNTNRDVDWFENDPSEEFKYISKLIADKLKGDENASE